MIEVLLTALPSICWLLLRCYRLLQTPAEKLIRQLNVDIPHTPSLCIDFLDSTQVEFHWDIEIGAEESIFYAVVVNGANVGTLAQTTVKLSNLVSDSLYSIQVVAVNSVSNFISRSPAVYVRTSGTEGIRQTGKIVDKLQLEKDYRKKLDLAADRGRKGLSAAGLTPENVASITCEVQLTEHLYLLQQELAKVAADHASHSVAQRAEEERLRGEIDTYKKKLSEGTDTRHKREQDVRELEKQKDSLTFTRLKLTKQIKAHESTRQMHESKLAELRTRVSKLKEKCQKASNSADAEEAKTAEAVKIAQAGIEKAKAATVEIEDALKAIVLQKRNLSNVTNQLRNIVSQFSDSSSRSNSGNDKNPNSFNECFSPDGNLTVYGAKLMQKLYSLRPDWEVELDHEIEVLHGLQSSWRELFHENIFAFLHLFNNVEIARFNEDHSYAPQTLSEENASLHFGGPSFVLPKQALVAAPQITSKKKAQLFFGNNSVSPSPPAPLLNHMYQPSDSQRGSISSTQNAPQIFEETPMGLTPENSCLSPQSVNASMTKIPYVGTENVRVTSNGSNSAPDVGNNPNSKWLDHQTYPVLDQPQYMKSGFDGDNRNPVFGKDNHIYALGSPMNLALPDSLLSPSHDMPQGYPQYSDMTQTGTPNVLQNVSQVPLNAPHMEQPMTPLYQPNYHENSQIPQNLQNLQAPQNVPQPFLGEFTHAAPAFTPEVHQPTPPVNMQRYSHNIGRNFPYGDSLFSSPPTQENVYLNPQLQPSALTGLTNSLWNNSSQSSFLDTRSLGHDSPQPQLQPQPQNTSESLLPSISHQSSLSTDGGFLNSILLPSASHHSGTKSIWSDRYVGKVYAHNRNVSSGSQLWGNDAVRREKSPKAGLASDFLPFSSNTLPSQNGASDFDDSAEYDIRSL